MQSECPEKENPLHLLLQAKDLLVPLAQVKLHFLLSLANIVKQVLLEVIR